MCAVALMALGARQPPMDAPLPPWYLDLLAISGAVKGSTADSSEAECAFYAAWTGTLGKFPWDVPLDFTRRLAESVLRHDDVDVTWDEEACLNTILNTRREAAWARAITAAMRDDDSAREYHAIVGAAHLYPARVRTPADMLHADVPPSDWPYMMWALGEWDARIHGPRLTELLPGEIVG